MTSTADADTGTAADPAVAVDAAGLASAVETVASFVACFEPERYSVGDASVLVDRFIHLKRLAATGEALAAHRAANGNAAAASGHLSPAHWLADKNGESVGQAADTLALGQAFDDHPSLEDACRKGKLSGPKARAVAEAASVNPDSEDELVGRAENDTLRQTKDRCARAKAQVRSRQDEATRAKALHDARYCRRWIDGEGAFHLEAQLTPEAGAALWASLSAYADTLFHRARRAGLREANQAYCADALAGLVTGDAPPCGPDPAGQANSAAPTGQANGPAPAGQANSPAPAGPPTRTPTGPRAQVIVRVDLDCLRNGVVGPRGICEIPGVGPVSVDTARSLMGDAWLKMVITNGVDVTTVCHLGRSIPQALRTALCERDRTCVVPGCDVATGLEIDHWGITFAEGGVASLDNLCRLCSHHHFLKTHRGFTLSRANGTWRWDPPPRGSTTDPPGTDPPGTDEPTLFSFDE